MMVCSFVAIIGVVVTYILTPTYDAQTLMQEGQYLALDHKFLQPSDADMMLLEGYEQSVSEEDNAEQGQADSGRSAETVVTNNVGVGSESFAFMSSSANNSNHSSNTNSKNNSSNNSKNNSNNNSSNNSSNNSKNNSNNSSAKSQHQEKPKEMQIDLENNFLLGDQHLHAKSHKSNKKSKSQQTGGSGGNSPYEMRQVIYGAETKSLAQSNDKTST